MLGALLESDVVGGVVDGDTIVARTIGWPEGAWWDELPKPEVRAFITQCWEQFAHYSRFFLVLTGVGPVDEEHAVQLITEFGLTDYNFFFAMPTFATLERNMELRAADQHPNDAQPVDAERAYETGIQTFSFFEGHVSGLSSEPVKTDLQNFFETLYLLYAIRKGKAISIKSNGTDVQVRMRGFISPGRVVVVRKLISESSSASVDSFWYMLTSNDISCDIEVMEPQTAWREVYADSPEYADLSTEASGFVHWLVKNL